ncbi:hypothetical protein CK500_03850 [Halorubrum salipaludis]|uniref:Uncharacterized protein n=1 Tax=Halorubrum salipaludis TaxID=2032630 RepID=A0A2A2FJ97_9EURY|nr:hypothetical protein [Halorubrum salipaludis]PAU84659.1 hypothetical protein CK500_03850 [Halorubrum salipaludis]
MPSRFDRRTALRVVGSSVALALAGCGANRGPGESNGSANGTDTSTPAPVTADDVAFEASATEPFTADHPARIRAELRNTAADPISVFTGVTPPFTSYLSDGDPDANRLVLVPEVPADESPLGWSDGTDRISETVESGCWNATRDAVIEEMGAYTAVAPGEALRQRYAVYGYQNESCLPAGTYAFGDDVTVHRGRPGDDAPESEATFGFALALADDGSLSVERDEATIGGDDGSE